MQYKFQCFYLLILYLTAGFYNRANRDGYSPIASMLKKPEAKGDPEGLVWQVT